MSDPVPQKTNRILDRTRVLMSQAVHAQQQGNFADAEKLYLTVLADAPEHADALHFLGLLKHQRDASPESIELMRKSLLHGLPNAGYMVNFGRVLQAHGRSEESIEYFRKAAALSPSFADAWLGLGQSHEMLDMPFKACEAYRKAYAIDPASDVNAMSLGRTLRNTGELQEAMAVCEKALQSHPGEAQFLYLEVLCLLDANRSAEALEKMQTALTEDPLSSQLHYSLGLVMAEQGDFEGAKRHYAKALDIDPQYYAVHYSLSAIQKTEKPAIAAFEQHLRQSPPPTPEAAVSAEFSWGKMLDDVGEYDQAFEHFKLGNRIMRELSGYDHAAQAAYSEGLRRHLGREFMARSAQVGQASETPVFIVGMVRSGTSLVEQILASHPDVAGGGELPYLPQSLTKFAESRGFASGERIAALPDESLRAVGERYLAKLTALYPDAKRITDKLPGNFMLIGLIRTLFPGARIIHCERDALDTCVSCYLTHFDSGHLYSYDLKDTGEYYLQYRQTLEHYQEALDARTLLTVRYEDLVKDPAAAGRRLTEFCGLEWDPICLEAYKASRLVKTASMYQVRQPVYTHAVGRWQRYAAHIEPLRQILGDSASG